MILHNAVMLKTRHANKEKKTCLNELAMALQYRPWERKQLTVNTDTKHSILLLCLNIISCGYESVCISELKDVYVNSAPQTGEGNPCSK